MNDFTPEEIAQIILVKNSLATMTEDFCDLVFDCAGASLQDFYVSGGVTASLIQGELPNDIDIYCRSQKALKDFQKYITTNHSDDLEEFNYRTVNGVTERAITMKSKENRPNYQFITMHTGEPEVVRKTFDFVHTTPYFDLVTEKLYISKKQFVACKNKILSINNSDAINDVRITKFKIRGYTEDYTFKEHVL